MGKNNLVIITKVDGRTSRHEPRRQEILNEAIKYVLKNGVYDLSIRSMASALGVSHVVLLHHFGSKEQMVVKLLLEIRKRMIEQIRQRGETINKGFFEDLDDGWKILTSDSQLSFGRALLEIYGVALREPDKFKDFLDDMIKGPLPQQAKKFAACGVSEKDAELMATITQSTIRGLILDLLATGDRKRIEDSYKMFRTYMDNFLERLKAK